MVLISCVEVVFLACLGKFCDSGKRATFWKLIRLLRKTELEESRARKKLIKHTNKFQVKYFFLD